MAQTLLATFALASVLFLSLNARQATHHRTAQSERGEIEVRLGQLGGDLLDFGATLPLTADAGSSESEATLWSAASLADWDGVEERVDLPAEQAALPVIVRVEVQMVRKQGDVFVETATPSPYRRVRLALRSAMGTAIELERIYSRP